MPTRLQEYLPLITGKSLVPFSDAFGGRKSRWTGAGFATSGGVATITPTVGNELVTDGALENWNSASDLTSWTETIGGASTVNREGTVIHGGSFACRLDVDAVPSMARIAQVILSNKKWYQVSVWAKGSAGTPSFRLEDSSGGAGPVAATLTITTDYAQYIGSIRSSTGTFAATRASNNVSIYLDDLSAREISLPTLFATVQARANVDAQVKITRSSAKQVGLVLNLDNPAAPANFIIAYLDAGNCLLDECVNGTYTNKILAAVTYGAGRVLRVVRDGTNCSVYYNGVQVGLTQTMTANTNTRHGLFSTHATNSFDDFSLR